MVEAQVRAYLASHSEEDLAEVLSACEDLVRGTIRRVPNPVPEVLDFDDLIQYGWMGLLGALRRYDPDRGVPFRPWAAVRIRGAAIDAIRRVSSTSRNRKVNFHSLPEDGHESEEYGADETMFDAIDALLPDSVSEALHTAVRGLPVEQAAILLMLMNGASSMAVARVLEKPSPTVRQVRDRALASLRESLLQSLGADEVWRQLDG